MVSILGRLAEDGKGKFRTLASEWQLHVVPMYKHSTQKNHRHILGKHLLPRFGDVPVSDVTRQEIQAYVSHLVQVGYAPKTIDHIHDVLSAILRTAVKWGHLRENPADGVDLPGLRCVKPKWVLDDSLRAAAAKVGEELFKILSQTGRGERANSLKEWLLPLDSCPSR